MGGISNSCYLSMTFTLRLLLSYFHDGLLTNFSQMKNAPNTSLIHGEIADYYLDYNGILISYSKNIKRTIANIAANIELVKSITQNKKVPLLIYLSKSPIPSRETQKFATTQLPLVYTAMAMVAKPGLAQLIMTLLFKFKAPPIPMKNFTNDNEAKAWLSQYL